MKYIEVKNTDYQGIEEMSSLASEIVKEYYEPILGANQNDYMIKRFQSVEAISGQLDQGYSYYFVRSKDGANTGFMAFYPREDDIYISKFYLHKDYRGNGISRDMLKFIKDKAKALNLNTLVLNVNKYNDLAINAYEKLGFIRIDDEKINIGKDYYMDDYVYRYLIS